MSRRGSRLGATCVAGLALILSAGCGDSSGPSGGGLGLTVVRGGGQADTALAKLVQALVIQVRDSTGSLAAGETVRFQAVPNDSPAYTASLFLAGLASPYYGTFVADSTDSKGLAGVLIQLGFVAGRGRVAVSVPRLGYQDTVSYTILPGSAAHLVAAPRDTAVFVGGGATLRAYVADAYGNRRDDPVTYQGLDAVTTVTPGGHATGASIGRSSILASAVALGVKDTVRISVVPQGTIAAVAFGFGSFPSSSIITLKVDGSGASAILQSAGDNSYLEWSPPGSSLVFFRPSFGGHVLSIDLSGITTQLVPAGTFAEDNWERYAAGGSYIYFRATRDFSSGFIWRIHPNGTGLDSVPVGAGTQPAPSPDGARVAYVSAGGGLRLYNYGTGTDSGLGVSGYAPHWSPDGTWIAYSTDSFGQIYLIKPDGTGRHLLVSGASYVWAFDWSPDSQWIVAQGSSGLEVIQVSSGLRLPLAFTTGLIAPSWKP